MNGAFPATQQAPKSAPQQVQTALRDNRFLNTTLYSVKSFGSAEGCASHATSAPAPAANKINEISKLLFLVSVVRRAFGGVSPASEVRGRRGREKTRHGLGRAFPVSGGEIHPAWCFSLAGEAKAPVGGRHRWSLASRREVDTWKRSKSPGSGA